MTAEDVTDINPNTPTDPLDQAIVDLHEKIGLANEHMFILKQLRETDHFKSLSKAGRNELLNALIDDAEVIRDLSRTVHNGLKKIKRERIGEEEMDVILMAGDRSW